MDLITLALAQAFAKATPGTAAASAAAAAESAAEAEAAAAAVTPSNADDIAFITSGSVTNTYAPQTDIISGTTVTINGVENHRYVCTNELVSISITPAANGVTDVLFKCGATPAALTLPNTVLVPAWFDKTSLAANATYELSILDGKYCSVAMWS